MTTRSHNEEFTDRMNAIQEARELSDSGEHDQALDLLRSIRTLYTSEEMQAKVEYLITLIEHRQKEDPTGSLHEPDEDDPSATRRIRRQA